MEYTLEKAKGKLDIGGKLLEPINLPRGAIVLQWRTIGLGTVLSVAYLAPVNTSKK